MKRTHRTLLTTSLPVLLGLVAVNATALVYEAERDLIGSGDFDGDGRQDIVIVDRPTGKCRFGYQQTAGSFTWSAFHPTGLKDVNGLAVGRLVAANHDSVVVTGADANQVLLVDAPTPTATGKPAEVPLAAQGPSAVAAVDVGGAGNTPLADLYIGTVYSEPPTVTLLRNEGGTFKSLGDIQMPAQSARANRTTLKAGGPELVISLLGGEEKDKFRAEDLSSGKPKVVLEIADVPKGSAYAVGNFRGAQTKDVVFYVPGTNGLVLQALEASGASEFKAGEAKSYTLEKSFVQAYAVPQGAAALLLVIYENGAAAEVFKLDGTKPPASVRKIAPATDQKFFSAAIYEQGFLMFSAISYEKYAINYETYLTSGAELKAGETGKLASLADTDDATIPDIHKRILAMLKAEGVAAEADMKPYTNTIPGSKVTYALAPIRGGTFTIGSPDGEAGRQADEGPQQKLTISPFWMGLFEVGWDEYQIFMYPDDEKKLRETTPSDPEIDKVSDVVARPSKPYVEMSFGMGKEGYPAISMTQHAANKYCHWLSAKTGHFYRLPTEAEWEYACRAGTTTAYSFGADASQLTNYAWFYDNGDGKYGKVGKKKPNPWGLYDMHGNAAEWCLDQYETNYVHLATSLKDPWQRATLPYPHSVRGGSYDDDPPLLRSAARRGSDRSWKMRDPQLPKSVWWFTDAKFVGFRLVRPLKVPEPAELRKYWTSGVEKD